MFTRSLSVMPVVRFRLAALAVAAAGVAVLAGCATAGPSGSLYSSKAPAVANAGFRLSGVRVVWQDNPAFSYRFSYQVPRYNPTQPASEGQRQQVESQMREILQFYRDEAVPGLTKALVDEGVGSGAEHRVVLTPLSGYQATSGAGTRIVVRATVVDASSGRSLWNVDITSHSGVQWFGPSFSKPDDTYVRNFVSSLVDTMRKAGLVGKA